MKNTSILLTTALASLIALAPAVTTSADAAGIKIRLQVVKVKPKIVVAKPRVRIKVKAARVRVKPKLRVKVKPKIAIAKPKVRIKVKPATAKLKPKIKPQMKLTRVKPKPAVQIKAAALAGLKVKPRLKPQILVKKVAATKPASMVKPPLKPAISKLQSKIEHSAVASVEAKFVRQNGIKDARQAARALAEARDAMQVGSNGIKATGKLGSGLNMVGDASTSPRSNSDIVKGMFRQPGGGQFSGSNPDGKWGNRAIGGMNADNFTGLENTHSPAGTNPNTAAGGAMAYWGKKRDSDIAGAIAGVAGDRTSSYRDGAVTVTKTVHDDGQVTQTKTENIYRGGEPANGQIGQLETTHRSGVED
jgi:hypothetical protein